jgi:hypothetical protein
MRCRHHDLIMFMLKLLHDLKVIPHLQVDIKLVIIPGEHNIEDPLVDVTIYG